MRIVIKRGTAGGYDFLNFENEKTNSKTQISRELTRTTGEQYSGIFTQSTGEIKFSYGWKEKTFISGEENFPEINFTEMNRGEIQSKLKIRIKTVKEWVESVDWTEEFSMEL